MKFLAGHHTSLRRSLAIPGATGALAVLLLFACMQFFFWWRTHEIKPQMTIVPNVPGEATIQALSLGEDQALFRALALQLQNFGDTFGRFTALKDYDYEKLGHWFALLDTLDDRSDYLPTLAAYYFSQTQNVADVRYMVDYLRAHSEHRIQEKWWWQAQAAYLANHKLKDTDLALEIALPLREARGVPAWVNQLPAFLYEQKGEWEAALEIMNAIKDNAGDLDEGELNFIQHFIDERLTALQEKMEFGEPLDAPSPSP